MTSQRQILNKYDYKLRAIDFLILLFIVPKKKFVNMFAFADKFVFCVDQIFVLHYVEFFPQT